MGKIHWLFHPERSEEASAFSSLVFPRYRTPHPLEEKDQGGLKMGGRSAKGLRPTRMSPTPSPPKPQP